MSFRKDIRRTPKTNTKLHTDNKAIKKHKKKSIKPLINQSKKDK